MAAPAAAAKGIEAPGIEGPALLLVAAVVVFKLWLAAWFPFTGDEAYFEVWGQQPAPGYYDHPPMVGWLLAAITPVSSAAWALRLPVIVLPIAIAWGLHAALRHHDRDKAWLAALGFLLLPINVWNVFITTDMPLVFFSFFAGLAWWQGRERRSLPLHVLAGVLLGGAFLSKYFSALLALVFLVDAALAPREERAWRGLVVTWLAATPFGLLNLWWNYEHCWANFMFNLYNRHEEAGWSIRSPFLYALIVVYTLSPVAVVQLARARAWVGARQRPGLRFALVAVVLPFGLFAILSLVRKVGLHWVLSFVPFLFVAAALVLTRAQLRRSVLYLGGLAVLHVALLLAAAAMPLETWKKSRLYDGIVFHFRIHDVVSTLKTYQPEFEIAADGYSPAVTAGYYLGRYVFVFGTASTHARHDDLVTDFRTLAGRNILVLRKDAPQPGEYEPYFQSVSYRTLELEGARFHLVLGRGFHYGVYRDRVLAVARDRFYRIPAYLPQGGCEFCERYFATYCPVRG
jgi:hypothetical protein